MDLVDQDEEHDERTMNLKQEWSRQLIWLVTRVGFAVAIVVLGLFVKQPIEDLFSRRELGDVEQMRRDTRVRAMAELNGANSVAHASVLWFRSLSNAALSATRLPSPRLPRGFLLRALAANGRLEQQLIERRSIWNRGFEDAVVDLWMQIDLANGLLQRADTGNLSAALLNDIRVSVGIIDAVYLRLEAAFPRALREAEVLGGE